MFAFVLLDVGMALFVHLITLEKVEGMLLHLNQINKKITILIFCFVV